jgi:hypothetical protein
MSVLVVGSDHIDYLVTAAVMAGIATVGSEQELGQALARANADVYLQRYPAEPELPAYLVGDVAEDDEIDDEVDESAQVRDWAYSTYRWRPVDRDEINPVQTARAIACWQYQVSGLDDAESRPGWSQMEALAAATGDQEDDEGLPWVWFRGGPEVRYST